VSHLDTASLNMMLSTLNKYATRKLTPVVLLELDCKDEFPHKILKELYHPAHLGLHLLFIPEEYGGLGGGAYDIYRVSEVMAAIDLGVATGVLATFLGSDPIKVCSSPMAPPNPRPAATWLPWSPRLSRSMRTAR
jgi:alkylation response protein AidB-like acyl-CoA dehydrogenase